MSESEAPDPGPNQNDVNRKQGVVNDLQGNLNESLDTDGRITDGRQRQMNDEQAATNEAQDQTNVDQAAANVASDERQDRAEAASAATGERRDAEHVAQGETNDAQDLTNVAQGETNDAQDQTNVAQDLTNVAQDLTNVEQAATNLASDERQNRAEADAAETTERRDAEHVAQGVTNVDQAATNVANDAAVVALQAVADAAVSVNLLLSANVQRGRRWTTALALVVLVMIFLGIGGAWRFQAVNHDANQQRAELRAQAAAAKSQAHNFCVGSQERSVAVKKELTFLVDYAIGENNPDPELRRFKAAYPAHLESVIPAPQCP